MTEDHHFPCHVGLEVDVCLLVGRVAPRLRQVRHHEIFLVGEEDDKLADKIALAAPRVVRQGEAAEVGEAAVVWGKGQMVEYLFHSHVQGDPGGPGP